jgi:hypothetical protein
MTLLARNEADIVDAQIAFHLHAGVDFVIATDNRSDDGTREILERYERLGVLHLLREDGDDMRQDVWVTRMARLAATEFGADWVLNTDADEFWWPRGGTFKEVLGCVPSRFGIVRGAWRHFLPRPEDGRFFAERMTVRLAAPAHPGEKATVYHAHQKIAHRAHPEAWVYPGNHTVGGRGLEPLRGWHPIEVLHFSLRSVAQAARKFQGGWLRNAEHDATLHQLRADEALRAGRVAEHFASMVVDDDALQRGLVDETLALDTRLRDALRSLRSPGDDPFPPPRPDRPLDFPRASAAEDGRYAGETAVLVGVDGIVRAEQRVAAFERRLSTAERTIVTRLRSRARRRRAAVVD